MRIENLTEAERESLTLLWRLGFLTSSQLSRLFSEKSSDRWSEVILDRLVRQGFVARTTGSAGPVRGRRSCRGRASRSGSRCSYVSSVSVSADRISSPRTAHRPPVALASVVELSSALLPVLPGYKISLPLCGER